MRKIIYLFLSCSLLTVSSCTDLPDVYIEEPENKPEETETVEFDWEVISSLTLNVSVPTLSGDIDKYYRLVQVFSDDSFEPSALISSGMAKPDEPFVTSMAIPKSKKNIYLLVKDASAQARRYAVEVSSTQTNLSINTGELSEYVTTTRSMRADAYVAPKPPEVTIPTEFDYVLNATDGLPAKMEEGKTYYIPRGVTVKVDNNTTFSNTLWHNAPQAAIYVAGKLEISSVAGYKINSKSFYILEGGLIEAEDFTYNNEALRNQDLTLYIGPGGALVSKTKVTLPNKRTTIINGGTVDCETFYMQNGSGAPGYLHVLGRISCKKFSLTWWQDNRIYLYGHSLIEASESGVLGCGTLTMYRDAILYFKTSVYYPGVNIIVPESEYAEDGKGVALFRMETTTLGSDRVLDIDGPLEIYAPMLNRESLYTALQSELSNGAYITRTLNDREVYIGRGEHNYNQGYGMFEIIDNDNDGIPNIYDEDDTNPNVASASSYPAANTFATIMFEDLWPHPGDYDMNDIVADIRVDWTTNSANKATAIDLKWKLRAAGSTKEIAMAVQLDQVAGSEIAGVEFSREIVGNAPFELTNGIETGSSQAIIPLFNKIEDALDRNSGQGTINTNPNLPYVQPYVESIRVSFKTPVDMSKVSINKLNFFITVGSREHEIHLANFKQTSKGKVLAAENNNLDPDNQYKTADTGMMWGLMVPQSIAYPKEIVNIENVYSRYRSWYTSNGTTDQDWYLDPADSSNAYSEPSDQEEEETKE